MKKSQLRKIIRKILKEQLDPNPGAPGGSFTSPARPQKPFIKPQNPPTSRVRWCCPDHVTVNGISLPLYHSYDVPNNVGIAYAPWKDEKGQCLYDKTHHMRTNPAQASQITWGHGQPSGQEPIRCTGDYQTGMTSITDV